MSLSIDDDHKTYLWDDVVVSADPTSSTIVLEITLNGVAISGSPFAMTWQGSPVSIPATTTEPAKWSQTARTNMRFAGSAAATSGSDVKPGAGTYVAQGIITTTDGQFVPTTAQRLAIG